MALPRERRAGSGGGLQRRHRHRPGRHHGHRPVIHGPAMGGGYRPVRLQRPLLRSRAGAVRAGGYGGAIDGEPSGS
jgi:hypothetical protein